jgi:SAM-dependent methyltransferase
VTRSRVGSATGRFSTVTSEGGLLSTDLLGRISDGDTSLEGLRPASYHLAPGERLGEIATRSWNRLVAAWKTYQETLATLSQDDLATTATRERWLLVLFSELGFGRLQPSRAITVGDKSYPISHLWGAVPIHLVGARVSLDHRTPGVKGAAGASPHSLVQEMLNRSGTHLWGIVSNGMRLRLLRDNASLVRTAHVEFDLESMMANEVFSDFALLWLVCHQSRFEGEDPLTWWIERWRNEGVATGTRALDDLRNGVEAAIMAFGAGFLAHRSNTDLRERLRSGELSSLDYYRQLLRLVYRLIFCFVAEDRSLLHDPLASERARNHYDLYYSTRRLRDAAGRRRGGPHGDLWKSLLMVFVGLHHGEEALGLPALGSFLFSYQSCPDLDRADVANADLLEALRHLAFTQMGSVRCSIDYRNLGPEELGSIYESLLELHPRLDAGAAQFELTTLVGHERKTTGSYYTPASLVAALLDSALDPVIDEVTKSSNPESALLALRVLDPACGSGHFLIAAAHRIATKLAAVRTSEEEPAPEAVRHALRDVIGHCLHGIDINPMAVELCKVNLWMEALEPGKPLSFLDHRIACGNALLGTIPALIEGGIPDDAFKALTGDDRQTVSSLKRENRLQRGGAQLLSLDSSGDPYRSLAAGFEELDALLDESISDVAEKEQRYAALVDSPEASHARLVADAWCAAFVIDKMPEVPRITQGVLESLRSNQAAVPAKTLAAIESIRSDYGFLHWHLAFPHILHVTGDHQPNVLRTGWSGGFDLIIGNPPWDKVEFHEKEFFAARAPDISEAAGARRKAMIALLEDSDPVLFADYQTALRHADGERHFLSESGRFPLCGQGRINTYAVFAEAIRDALAPTGRAGIVVPTGIATDDTTKEFFGDLASRGSLISLLGFYDRKRLFTGADVHSFCLLTVAGVKTKSSSAEFLFFARDIADLNDSSRRFTLTPEDLALLNPNTRTCPVFRTRRDAEITRGIYERMPILIRKDDPKGNPWAVTFRQGLFNMTSDSGLFRTRQWLEERGFVLEGNVFQKGEKVFLPLYEGKMVHHFDHRWAGVGSDGEFADITPHAKSDPRMVSLPRYWVEANQVDERLDDQKWLLGFRDIARATDERTVIASVIPRVAVGNKLPLLLSDLAPARQVLLGASLTSFALDFTARQKVGGTTLNFFLVNQFPVLPPETFDQPTPWARVLSLGDWIISRVLELTFTAWDLATFASDLGYEGPPFRWEEDRRQLLRAELDACFFQLYGIERNDVEYVMSTFPVVCRRDEVVHGDYRTARLILECYDALDKAVDNGQPYQTILDPPPAHPSVAHA